MRGISIRISEKRKCFKAESAHLPRSAKHETIDRTLSRVSSEASRIYINPLFSGSQFHAQISSEFFHVAVLQREQTVSSKGQS